MKFISVLFVVLACVLCTYAKVSQPSIGINAPSNSSGADAKCIICGIVVNEIQGMVAENITEDALEKILTEKTCGILPAPAKDGCDELVKDLPDIINRIESNHTAGVICVEKNYCAAPFTMLSDPQPVPTYQINLDLPPLIRWSKICSNTTYKRIMGGLIDALGDLFHNSTLIVELGRALNDLYFPIDLAEEIRGCAAAMGVEYGWLAWVNLGYEVTEACTSIVSQTTDGHVYHVRNMDFWDGIWLTDHLKNLTMTLEYTKGGKTVFYATSFAGYVGVLSGMKPGAFSISLNTRYYPSHGLENLLYEIVAAIKEKNSTLVSFLTRKVMESEGDYNAAVENLSTGTLIADVYYIIGGVNPNEGAVISRNRFNASDIWRLNSTNWYVVQTNYDHWKQPPWYDDRVVPANEAMQAMGQENISFENLFKVLSVKPVLNLQSTFTMLTSAAQRVYTSLTRWCPYPCVE